MPLPTFGDFGLGLPEDLRREAMKRALVDAGLAISQGAVSEGFGAFARLGPAFTQSYGQNLDDADRLRRQRAIDEQNEEYRRERIESLEASREERNARIAGRDAEATKSSIEKLNRRRAIAGVEDPKLRGELQLRIGQSNFWEVFDRKTKPEEADGRAPTTRNFPDGSLRQWDPESGDWKVLGSKPEEGEGGLLDDATRGRLRGELEVSEDARKEALKRADAEIKAIRAENEKGTAPPKPVPDRLDLARRYEAEERDAARYRHGVAAPAPSAPPAAAAPAAPPPPAAAGREAPPPTPEQTAELRSLIEARVSALGLPPAAAAARKAQILARARQALDQGVSPEEILQELR